MTNGRMASTIAASSSHILKKLCQNHSPFAVTGRVPIQAAYGDAPASYSSSPSYRERNPIITSSIAAHPPGTSEAMFMGRMGS